MSLFPASWWQRITQALRWRSGKTSEVAFWERYLKSGGMSYKEEFADRLNPALELDEELGTLASGTAQSALKVLDVGAGPLSILGKCWKGARIDLTAVDPLAPDYDKLLAKYNINPPVRTQEGQGETVASSFPTGTFDLVHARNSLDHGLDPFQAVLRMVDVVKPGGWVFLKHQPNEGTNEDWHGLHQWNFSMGADGSFLIGSRKAEANVTQALAGKADVRCEFRTEPGVEWIVVKIQKKAA